MMTDDEFNFKGDIIFSWQQTEQQYSYLKLSDNSPLLCFKGMKVVNVIVFISTLETICIHNVFFFFIKKTKTQIS